MKGSTWEAIPDSTNYECHRGPGRSPYRRRREPRASPAKRIARRGLNDGQRGGRPQLPDYYRQRRGCQFGTQVIARTGCEPAITTLAELFTSHLAANPLSAMGASLWRRSKDEFGDGVPHGWQGRLRRRAIDSFFPPRCRETTMLEEGIGDHRHERVTMKALPGCEAPRSTRSRPFFCCKRAISAAWSAGGRSAYVPGAPDRRRRHVPRASATQLRNAESSSPSSS
jgi:hypothetical protein